MRKRNVRQARTAERQHVLQPPLHRKRTLLRRLQKPPAQRQQRSLLFFQRAFARYDQRGFFPLCENEPRSLLAAKPHADLRAAGKKAAVTRMIGADLAEQLLSAVQDQVAEIACIQKRAALVLAQNEMRRIAVLRNGCAQALAQRAVHGAVSGKRAGVDVDLPPDAAVVAAALRNAVKLRIIVRIYIQHSSPSLLLPPL